MKKQRAGSVLRVAMPFKAWAQRFAIGLLVLAVLSAMFLGKTNTALVEKARVAVTDSVAPILEAFSQPVVTASRVIEEVDALRDLRAENAALRAENERLMQWQSAAQRLDGENQALRRLLNLVPEPEVRFLSARVIADQGGAYVRSVLVNAGTRHGVAKGQAVMTGEGLAGRVAQAGRLSSRVLLVTDINSRIPVVVGRLRDPAVIAGDNSTQPQLLYLDREAQVRPGDRVVTSGHGGVFPPGLPIGVVVAGGDGGLRVQPLVDWDHMEFVRLVDFALPGILEEAASDLTAEKAR